MVGAEAGPGVGPRQARVNFNGRDRRGFLDHLPTEKGPGRHPPLSLSWLVWGLAALLYLLGFYQRVAPAVLTDELMADFRIGGTGLGHLSALYLYAYMAMQIPTGLLADSWGPRKVLFWGALLAAGGGTLFSLSGSFFWAGLGRFVYGGAVAVAFVVALKLAVHWFPPRWYSLAAGLGLICGVFGAVTAGVPLRLAVDAFGWRPAMLVTSLICLPLAAAVWILVRDDPSERGYLSRLDIPDRAGKPRAGAGPLAGLKEVFSFRNSWLIFFSPGALAGAVLSFSGLWGTPFLKAKFGLTTAQAAVFCSIYLICWALPGPLAGLISDRINRRKPVYLSGYVITTLAWTGMIYLPDQSLPVFGVLMVTAGLASGTLPLSFPFAKESVPLHLAGSSAGVVNMGVMIGPTILQPAIGWVLDQRWTGGLVNGARIYDPAAYKAAFSLILVWLVAACILVALTKETNCRQRG